MLCSLEAAWCAALMFTDTTQMYVRTHLLAGDTVPGAALSFGLDAAAFLRGRIDLRCVAAAGHR